MIDASRGFIKDGNKNRLRSQDIHKIVDVFNRQTELERYSRMVPLHEIADPRNDYNLNIPRYIDSSEPEDIQDLHAHIHGGIPDRDLDALSGYWEAFPSLHATLFSPNRPGYSDLTVGVTEVQQTILDSAEFQKFATDVRSQVDDWFAAHRPVLRALDADTVPKQLIAQISDDLLARFKDTPLLDEYDVYEQLMTYWHEILHDDVFLIMYEGWRDAALPRKTIEDKERKLSETPDLVIGSGRRVTKYKMDLIPPELIVARYFADEQAEVDRLASAGEETSRAVEEYVEEHAVEDGLLAEAMEGGRISKRLASKRLEAAQYEEPDPEEIKVLRHLIRLYDDDAAAKRAARETQDALDLAVLRKYGDLTEPEIKQLVLDDKWHATIADRVAQVAMSLTLALVSRIQQLGERYAETVAQIDESVDELEAKVRGHLAAMGVL